MQVVRDQLIRALRGETIHTVGPLFGNPERIPLKDYPMLSNEDAMKGNVTYTEEPPFASPEPVFPEDRSRFSRDKGKRHAQREKANIQIEKISRAIDIQGSRKGIDIAEKLSQIELKELTRISGDTEVHQSIRREVSIIRAYRGFIDKARMTNMMLRYNINKITEDMVNESGLNLGKDLNKLDFSRKPYSKILSIRKKIDRLLPPHSAV